MIADMINSEGERERLHVLYSFPNRVGLPGIGTIAWHHVNELVRLGAKVTLCCGSCERPIPGLYRLVETMKFAGRRIPYRVVGYDRAYVRHDRVIARYLARNSHGVDVVHGWPMVSLETFGTAKKLRIPTVLERPNSHTRFAYEIVAREHEKLGFPVPRENSHAFRPKRLDREEAEYAIASQLLCPSEFVAQTFRDRGFQEHLLAKHRYGFDPAVFHLNEIEPSEVAGSGFTMAFVGRCEPRKGLHYALQAWHNSGLAAMPDSKFVICGTFVRGYREGLVRWLDHPSVEELPFTNDVRSVMQRANVFTLPSIEEGSALVTYEARACGTVLLVSDASGAVCTHMEDSLVHPAGDLDTLTDQLAMVARDRTLLEKLRRASLQRVPKLTWTESVRNLYSIYEALARPPLRGYPKVTPVA